MKKRKRGRKERKREGRKGERKKDRGREERKDMQTSIMICVENFTTR